MLRIRYAASVDSWFSPKSVRYRNGSRCGSSEGF